MGLCGLVDGVRKLDDKIVVVSERFFDYKGIKTQELIIKLPNPTIQEKIGLTNEYKMIWCRDHISTIEIEGRENPMVHVDYPDEKIDSADTAYEDAARRGCRKSYDKYWC